MMAWPSALSLAATAFALLARQQPAQIQAPNVGTLRVGLGPPGTVIDPRSPSIKQLPVRLCSLDRVLQSTPDPRGAFTFANVPTGTYDLLVGNPLWSFFTVQRVEIEAGKAQSATISTTHHQGEDSPCFRDTRTLCYPATYTVTYSPPSARSSAEIVGQVFGIVRRRKGLANVHISIFRPEEKSAAYATVTDKDGRFRVDLRPGIYRLAMSRKGFHDLKIPDFLVPLENETNITMDTERTDAIILCQ